MNISITGAAGSLGRAITTSLSEHHYISPTDIRMAPGARMIVRADVLDIEAVEELCKGMDAVIHLAQVNWDDQLSDAENERRILETRLKGTYNVLKCASEAGVSRVIQVSDLCIFSGYDEDILISEDFLPLPDTTVYQQSVYLSELIACEFAQQYPGMIVTLRLGNLVDHGHADAESLLKDNWIDYRDATTAIERAVMIDQFDGSSKWGVYNLVADQPNKRYSLLKISSGHFGFNPRF
jgi:uronate dehydrogenase